MIYNVSSLLTAREGAVRLETLEDGAVFTDRHRFYRISGPVQMLRTDRTILVSASVSATVKESCGRCLSPATIDIKTEFEEEFEPANRDLMSDRPSPVESDFDPALQIDARNMLDISDALAQALHFQCHLRRCAGPNARDCARPVSRTGTDQPVRVTKIPSTRDGMYLPGCGP